MFLVELPEVVLAWLQVPLGGWYSNLMTGELKE